MFVKDFTVVHANPHVTYPEVVNDKCINGKQEVIRLS